MKTIENLSHIKDITFGAVRIEEEESGIYFYCFTKEQTEISIAATRTMI